MRMSGRRSDGSCSPPAETVEAFIRRYWRDVAAQDRDRLRSYFQEDACIRWHNTGEQFDVEEFLQANCDYPGQWSGEVERFVQTGSVVITVVRVWTEGASFHVVSFIALQEGRIREIDEYWGDDGPAPQWRRDRHLGSPLHPGPGTTV